MCSEVRRVCLACAWGWVRSTAGRGRSNGRCDACFHLGTRTSCCCCCCFRVEAAGCSQYAAARKRRAEPLSAISRYLTTWVRVCWPFPTPPHAIVLPRWPCFSRSEREHQQRSLQSFARQSLLRPAREEKYSNTCQTTARSAKDGFAAITPSTSALDIHLWTPRPRNLCSHDSRWRIAVLGAVCFCRCRVCAPWACVKSRARL